MHDIIEPLSTKWWLGLLGSILYFIGMYRVSLRSSRKQLDVLRKILGIAYLLVAFLMHPYLMYLGVWTREESLPLHLCALSNLLAGFTMLKPGQRSFELLLYWGIPGGIHSILTPEVTAGSQGLLLYEYYFLHINIIFAPVFLMRFYGLFPKIGSWFTAFLLTQVLLPFIGFINWLFNANYMYLSHRPLADNPFIIGEWPWYILVLEGVMLGHFYLVYRLIRFYRKRFPVSPEVLRIRT